VAATWTTDFRFGGCGGAYFLASPGPFWVDIEKQDLNRKGRHTHLRAILFGPDRRVIDEQWLPDDGKEKGGGVGPVQRVRLATTVPRKGIYGVNITVTEDRYGEDFVWGFRTSCPKYLVETSRGHRDARHEEPLVLRNPEVPGDVCFMPRHSEIAMEVAGLPAGSERLTVYDAEGNQVAELPVGQDGKVGHTFAEGTHRDAVPWRLHLPKFSGVVQIDGVTRWAEREGGVANLSFWTPQQESWFPFHENRWLLTPYSRVAYSESGAAGSVAFLVHNNASAVKRVALGLEYAEDQRWQAELSRNEFTLAPGESSSVSVRYRVPAEGDAWVCHLRVTPQDAPEMSTYSTFELRRGAAPAGEPVPIPLVLEPYEHENEQFGYLPAYPLANQVYFDMANCPVVAADKGVSVWRDGVWAEVDSAVAPGGGQARFSPRTSKVAFDRDNGMYVIGEQGGTNVLLHSRDGGRSFGSCRIPGGGSFDIEQFSGHNLPDGPPPFVRYTLTAKDPKVFWRRLNDLHLFLPEVTQDGTLALGEPVLVSKKCIGSSMHSGIPSSIVSRDGKVHVAWGEATEPDEDAPGVPTFVATYDRAAGALSEPALVGYGPPANDVHNTPCITMDSQGYLHVLVGTHGRTFQYARSLEPNSAAGGWTEAEDIGSGLRQTYVGLVCGQDDALHLVFRLWRTDTTYFPASSYATLAYMSKRRGALWSEACPLIVAPFSDYSIFYHRLTIDRAGALFLSYDYWSTYWFYRMDHRGTRRALLTSSDSGATWKLAGLEDLTR
jgi:BNR repeat-containing family member